MTGDLPSLAAAQKSLLRPPKWVGDDSISFLSSLDINGVTRVGLQLRCTAIRRFPDRDVMFQLELHPPGRKVLMLSRICWRPFSPHNNHSLGPEEYRNMLQRGSHHHAFNLNYLLESGQMRAGNIKVAVPLPSEPANFSECVAFVGEAFKIVNTSIIPPPPWRTDFL